ncbi:family 78 glycoside hydrolase catalytic domain [Streptomyces sp. NPDC049954]|uniref:family 78 glycoside hydrolase catalytic domain n=1 Tax=Streptomyces sp. NPDC049954 TaxID=3155779 RepID=UPI00341D38D6
MSAHPTTELSEPDVSPAPRELRADDQSPTTATADRFVAVLTSLTPTLSWVVPLVRRGQLQRAYQVRAWIPGAGGGREDRELWDSGRVEGDSGVHVPWTGAPLPPLVSARWAVRVWDETDRVSGWSAPGALETGPADEDWDARWLEVPARHAARRVLTLPHAPRRARLYFTAQGLVRVHVNGRPVNPDSCDPSRTEQHVALYRCYDVTDLLGAGDNAITLITGTGKRRDHDSPPRVLATLVGELSDGGGFRAGTGAGWRYGPTPVVAEENHYLEHHDATVGDGWDTVAFDDAAWRPCAMVEPAGLPSVLPDPGPALRVVREREAVEIGRPAPGVRVYDVGENLAGRSELTLHGVPAGTVLEAVHGELLDAAGRVCTTNIRLPSDVERERQVFRCTAGGREGERAGVWFAFHGFRYVEVRGVPEAARVGVTGRALHSDVPRIGTVRADDPLVEQMVDAAVRTQWNNLHALPEDCPTREQQGWTGDASVSAAAAVSHLDMAGVYRKWLRDIRAGQRADGAVPAIVPQLEEAAAAPDPVWGSAYNVIVREHYLRYGDLAVVHEHIGALRRWADHQLGLVGPQGLVTEVELSYGFDWLALRQTPPVLLQTCAVIASLRDLADLEAAIGEDAQAVRRRAEADRLVAAARRLLRDPVTGRWANGTQAAAALALACGLAESAAQEAGLLAELAAAVHDGGDRVTSGFSATQSLVRALGGGPVRPGADSAVWRPGAGAALLAALHQPRSPGIGAMLAQGPGTLWECWWIDAKNTGTGSLDHIGMGAPFAEWVWRRLVGIEPDLSGPGFARFTVAPRPVPGLNRVSGEVRTVRGTVAVAWERTGAGPQRGLALSVTVPVGSEAVIRVPGGAHGPVLADGLVLGERPHPQLRVLGRDGEDLLVGAPAGSYALESAADGDERAPLLGAAPAARPGEPVRVPLVAGTTPGDVRALIGAGWSAEAVAGGGEPGAAPSVLVTAPVDAAPDATARLEVGYGERRAERVLRVETGASWLSDGTGAEGWRAVSGGASLQVLDTPECRPVFHEPVSGAVLLVGGEPCDPRQSRTVRLDLPRPADLRAARYAYAHVDQCVPAPADSLMGRAVLRLIAADGSVREGYLNRPLPAGWNRVTVDLADGPEAWEGQGSVVAIEVAVHHPDAGGVPFPVSFFLGRVGWTSAPRTW